MRICENTIHSHHTFYDPTKKIGASVFLSKEVEWLLSDPMAYQRLTGRCWVGVTHYKKKHVWVKSYRDNHDVYAAVMGSCHIPIYCAPNKGVHNVRLLLIFAVSYLLHYLLHFLQFFLRFLPHSYSLHLHPPSPTTVTPTHSRPPWSTVPSASTATTCPTATTPSSSASPSTPTLPAHSPPNNSSSPPTPSNLRTWSKQGMRRCGGGVGS